MSKFARADRLAVDPGVVSQAIQGLRQVEPEEATTTVLMMQSEEDPVCRDRYLQADRRVGHRVGR
jgi:hypothetical protein